MEKDLKVKRRSETRLYHDEILEMIIMGLPGDITPEEICEANDIDFKQYIDWREKFLIGGIERLRGIWSAREKAQAEEIRRLRAFIKASDQVAVRYKGAKSKLNNNKNEGGKNV
jgi:hypothetical protein